MFTANTEQKNGEQKPVEADEKKTIVEIEALTQADVDLLVRAADFAGGRAETIETCRSALRVMNAFHGAASLIVVRVWQKPEGTPRQEVRYG